MVPVVIGTTFLIYTMVWDLPGDPFAGRCGQRPCPPAYVALMREKFNLDDPLIVSYLKYLGNVLTGNFGETFQGLQVRDEILRAYPITMKLALVAIIFEIVIGIGAGVLAGLRRGSFWDNLVLVVDPARDLDPGLRHRHPAAVPARHQVPDLPAHRAGGRALERADTAGVRAGEPARSPTWQDSCARRSGRTTAPTTCAPPPPRG